MRLDGDMWIERAQSVVFRELESDGGGVLLRIDDGAYHGLNQMGTVIWTMIGDGMSLDDLVAAVELEVDNPPPEMRAEVEAFVSALEARGLVVVNHHE